VLSKRQIGTTVWLAVILVLVRQLCYNVFALPGPQC
jgi:hypothetical protein